MMIMLHLISRATAKEYGLKKYFTGKPCRYRQYAERKIGNKNCTCFLCEAVHRTQMKEWRQHNPGHVTKWRKEKRVAPHNPTFIEKENQK